MLRDCWASHYSLNRWLFFAILAELVTFDCLLHLLFPVYDRQDSATPDSKDDRGQADMTGQNGYIWNLPFLGKICQRD